MRTDIQYTKDRYGYSRKVETMALFLLCGSERNEGLILRFITVFKSDFWFILSRKNEKLENLMLENFKLLK